MAANLLAVDLGHGFGAELPESHPEADVEVVGARRPWERDDPEERERARYRGVVWRGRRILQGPGDRYRAIFGAPDAEEDDEWRRRGLAAGAQAGGVVFHDALYVPHQRREGPAARPEGGRASRGEDKEAPFAVDVLTVHQFPYYSTAGKEWPNDFDSPNPVSFLTVRPGSQFLFAWSSDDPELLDLVAYLLPKALAEWGIGGKTSLGYGRFGKPGTWRPPAPGDAAGAGATPGPRALGGRPQGERGPSAPARPRAEGAPRAGAAPGGRGAAGPQYRRGMRIVVRRVEDPSGKGRLRFQADDGLPGQFISETPPEMPIGGTLEVWVANASPTLYTFTLKDPNRRR